MYRDIDLIMKIKLYKFEFDLLKKFNKKSPKLVKNYKYKLKNKILDLNSKIDDRFK
ncbi:hypothetical protein I3900191A7_14770 [Clostridium baratii]|uniref:hypothetical protein n=1 Tax=Clostridium baratii TaxID=1561 RepID=UPI0036F19558